MKVPRPNLGVDAEIPATLYGAKQVARMTLIDFITQRFRATLDNNEVVVMKLRDYDPAPTMNNFLRAIAEWDYHYSTSDDPRLYEEGKEMEQALIELFRALPQEDQHQCRKIVEIVVMSTQPK